MNPFSPENWIHFGLKIPKSNEGGPRGTMQDTAREVVAKLIVKQPYAHYRERPPKPPTFFHFLVFVHFSSTVLARAGNYSHLLCCHYSCLDGHLPRRNASSFIRIEPWSQFCPPTPSFSSRRSPLPAPQFFCDGVFSSFLFRCYPYLEYAINLFLIICY